MYYCFPIFGKSSRLEVIDIPIPFVYEKVFVSSDFWGVKCWYQSFSLSELGIDCTIPRLKFSKVLDMSPTLGKVLGGESVKIYGNTLVGILMKVKKFLCMIYS